MHHEKETTQKNYNDHYLKIQIECFIIRSKEEFIWY